VKETVNSPPLFVVVSSPHPASLLPDKRRKGLLGNETKAVLMDWLETHYDEPVSTTYFLC